MKFTVLIAAAATLAVLSGTAVFQEYASAGYAPDLSEERLAQIDGIVEDAVRSGRIPGAVVVIGNKDKKIYRRAFGYRSILPEKLPMTEDTIFDVASITKAVATTTAVMQLAEKGKLRLDDPVYKYWRAFKTNGKKHITIHHLLTHYSGLRPDIKMKPKWSGYKAALKKIVSDKPVFPPDSRFIYSDVNFAVLGEIVRKVSGMPLDSYCSKYIFKPLGMNNTGFNPPLSQRSHIAPTEYLKSELLQGKVHDPAARRMGGVAGHAGLFSTADDLAVFAKMLLNKGSFHGKRILRPDSIESMTLPQSPVEKKTLRGLGWDIDAPLVSNREDLPPVGAYGHLGYTGTAVWIDPVTEIYVIVLTNRVHPYGKGDVKELRARIKESVSKAVGYVPAEQVIASRPLLSPYIKPWKKHRAENRRTGNVFTGIDVLYAEDFTPLKGRRIGLITNHSGLDSEGRRTIDLIYNAAGIKLTAVFSPEHGLFGKADNKVPSSKDPETGLPVYSLYGDVRRPNDEMLKDIDALVFDIQDAGARFYTYITTMGYVMEAASKMGIEFYVLDRPNPITASIVQGPVMDTDKKSFTGYFPLPVRHGMTVGELAGLFNIEYGIGVRLRIIKMQGYERTYWYDETGLKWVNPSPNLRNLNQTILYPGVALAEGANVSVGRGTGAPFEFIGAPWINDGEFSSYLSARGIKGVRFEPVQFAPESGIYKNRLCRGAKIILENRGELDAAALGIELVSALYRLYPGEFKVDKTLGLIGAQDVLNAIKQGRDPQTIVTSWQGQLEEFLKLRKKYLLY